MVNINELVEVEIEIHDGVAVPVAIPQGVLVRIVDHDGEEGPDECQYFSDGSEEEIYIVEEEDL